MNVVLCGMMGVGKTTIGAYLAQVLGFCQVDTDDLIVKKYGDISTIFERRGEEYFRAIETEIVRALVQEGGLVISVGGGLVLKEENVSLLKKNGKIVYLRAEAETLAARLSGDMERPLLKAGNGTLLEKIEKLLAVRESTYQEVADFTIDIDGKTPEEIAGEIMAILQENN